MSFRVTPRRILSGIARSIVMLAALAAGSRIDVPSRAIGLADKEI
jgi:hypothetical protein